MWILLVLSLAGISALTILQTPREWFKRKLPRTLVIIYHTIGITSIALILFVVWRMPDGPLREAVVWAETVYFTIAIFGLVLSAIRYSAFEFARHFRQKKVLQLLESPMAFILAVVLVSTAYMIPSVYFATNMKTTEYSVSIDKKSNADTLRIALISDFHIGAGARHREMDQMVQKLAQSEPELILIAGDVCDSSSSANDLEYMEEVLKKLDCRYGVFYAEGNHEKECRISPDPYLTRAGVTILRDKGIKLENGVNIIGRKNALQTSVELIMQECGLDENDPTIVLQHRPRDLDHMGKNVDLVLLGHTHGYQFPFLGIMAPYFYEQPYGLRIHGDTTAIVSAGVAEWGYRTKWPSQSEITVINVGFGEDRT